MPTRHYHVRSRESSRLSGLHEANGQGVSRTQNKVRDGRRDTLDDQGNQQEALKQFWSEPKHARLIDAETVRACFACATIEALVGNMVLARKFSLLGTIPATWFKLGNDAFLEDLLITMENPNIRIMLDLW
jgi:hypothetical protein